MIRIDSSAPWLLAIARRRIGDRLWHQSRRAAAETAFEPKHETISAPGPNLHTWLLRRRLREAIQKLPAGQRRAVLLLEAHGLPLKEAASQSGMSAAAVKVASHRGIKALRATFGEGSQGLVATPELIETLIADARPVRRLRPPLVRAASWLLLAGLVLLALAAVYGARPDLSLRLRDSGFAAPLGASLSTGILAAIAAFNLSLPDRSRLWSLLPVPALVLWISTIGYGCLTEWVSIRPDGVRLGTTLDCFTTLLIASVPTSALLLVMLRHTARLYPTAVAMMSGLASAGIAATALSFFHELDASVMVLLWNLGAPTSVVALAGMFGPTLFASMSRCDVDG